MLTPKVTSAEDNFNNKADRMIHFVAVSQLLSPVTVIAQGVHEQSDHGGRNGCYAWVQ
jgi:hypothetical protein